MPFGDMWLEHRDNNLTGVGEIEEARFLRSLAGFGGPPFGGGGRIQRYVLAGSIAGRTCEFRVSVSPKDGSASTLYSGKSFGGYLVFHSDGRSAQYAQLKEKKLSKFSTVERVLVAADTAPEPDLSR
jgi:hypothetical protein